MSEAGALSEVPSARRRREARADTAHEDMSPIVLARGLGSTIDDVDGNRFVDLASGFGSVLLGHGDGAWRSVMASALADLTQGLGDLYPNTEKLALSRELAALVSGGARVLIGQSGADALTAALKTAILTTGRAGVAAFRGAYHGLGYAPLAACGYRPSFREPFAEALNRQVSFFDFPRSEEALVEVLSDFSRVAARGELGCVLVEPILGRGGVVAPPPGFLARLGEIAKSHGVLVVADEIWTGLGRSGAMLSAREAGLEADIVCLGKGLGGGIALSACVGTEAAMSGWATHADVVHTSTHAGSPLACASALFTLRSIRERGLVERARDLGARFKHELSLALADRSDIVEVRGAGLMIGIVARDGRRGLGLMRALLRSGYLTTIGGDDNEVLVLTPALTVEETQLAAFVSCVSDLARRDSS